MKRDRFQPWMLFIAVGVLMMVTALIPMLRGNPMNVVFFSLGTFWLILAAAARARVKKGSDQRKE